MISYKLEQHIIHNATVGNNTTLLHVPLGEYYVEVLEWFTSPTKEDFGGLNGVQICSLSDTYFELCVDYVEQPLELIHVHHYMLNQMKDIKLDHALFGCRRTINSILGTNIPIDTYTVKIPSFSGLHFINKEKCHE